MADAKQSFPILASPIARLDDRKWLATLSLQDKNVVKSEPVLTGFDNSFFCRKAEPRVRRASAADLSRTVHTEML